MIASRQYLGGSLRCELRLSQDSRLSLGSLQCKSVVLLSREQ